jgi:AAA+ ATPase superfamily predicted ATPase
MTIISLMRVMENPFEYQRIVAGKTFVDREEELKSLIDALLSGENVLLHSPRRLGKSSLLKETLQRIGNKRLSIYIDLWECLSEEEIAEKLISGIINTAYTTLEKAAAAMREMITSARPLLTVERDGSIGIKLEFIEREKTLKEALAMIQKVSERRGKKVVVVVDECQVIAEFEGHRVEKVFRTTLQEQTMVTYVFSGSKQHVLKAMVTQKTRPFYRQLRPMTLGPITIGAFTPFIKNGFAKVGGIDDIVIEEIYRFVSGNPQRTQQICHFLFSKAVAGEPLTSTLVEKVVLDICLSLDKEFEDELDGIKNTRQRRILKALAIEATQKPLSSEFLKKYSLGPASSVQTALKGLLEKGILDEKYEFVDPLFKTWFVFRYRNVKRL